MARFCENFLPVPRPIKYKEVSEQLASVRRANHLIVYFLKQFECELLTSELDGVLISMQNTQQLDMELAENEIAHGLFKALTEACRDLVPGGTNRIELAEKEREVTNYQRKSSMLSLKWVLQRKGRFLV